MNTSLYLICTGWNFVTAEYLTASSSISIHVLILPVYQCVALLFNFSLPCVLDRKNLLLMYSLERKNTEIMTSFDRFTNSSDFLKESEASFSWLTSGGSGSCHSSEERNKKNHNLIQTVPVIHYSRRESYSVHNLKGLFIQISEEIIFFSDVWNFHSHLIFVILRRAAEFQLSEGVLLVAAGGRFSYHFVNWECEYLPFL